MATPADQAALAATLAQAGVAGSTTSTTIETVGSVRGTAPSVLADRWEIVGLIGTGGMGAVYRAYDRELDDTVALKMLRADVLGDDGLIRFRREVKLARRVTHRNVARVFDMGDHQGVRFFTMELVEGDSLRGLVAREGALPVARVIEIGLCIARGLAAAHEVGVVHRDLKPDNVLLGRDGRIAITDFGIAASMEAKADGAKSTAFLGTPTYMAPEQVDRSEPVGPRADIYALGGLLFELATGEPPWKGETALAIAAARLVHPPPDPRAVRPSLSEALALLVKRCLARSPAERFGSAEEVERALGEITPQASASIAPSAPSRPGDPVAAGQERGRQVKIAILPLHNSGGDADAYLAEGLTEDLIDAVSMARALRVTARGLVEKYAGKRDIDARLVGRELDVEVLATGSVRRLPDDRVRVTLRLVSAADGIQIWAKRFETAERDLLQVNDQAADAIASAVTVTAPGVGRELSDPVAVDLYLRARSFRFVWGEAMRTPVDHFRAALARVPNDPLLLSGYATSLARFTFFSGAGIAEARAAAERAVEAAPHLGESHLALGTVALQEGDLTSAILHGKRALGSSPCLADAHLMVGRVLGETGPFDDARQVLTRALELDPTSGATIRELARLDALAGDWEGCEVWLSRLRAISGPADELANLVTRVRFAWWRRDEPDLVDLKVELEQLAARSPEQGFTPAAVAQRIDDLIQRRKAGSPELLAQTLGTSGGNTRRNLFFLQTSVETSLYVDDLDVALAWLTRAVDLGLHDLLWLERCELLAPLRARPEHSELHRRMADRTASTRAAWRA